MGLRHKVCPSCKLYLIVYRKLYALEVLEIAPQAEEPEAPHPQVIQVNGQGSGQDLVILCTVLLNLFLRRQVFVRENFGIYVTNKINRSVLNQNLYHIIICFRMRVY